jgi:integrase
LPIRHAPHWRNIQEGRAIGYRRNAAGKAGTWQARFLDRDATGVRVRKFVSIGTADDMLDADGVQTLTFAQAQEAAREWFSSLIEPKGVAIDQITVADAMTAYVADYMARGGKDKKGLDFTIAAHIAPKLAEKKVSELTAGSIRTWLRALATAPRRLRASKKPGKRKPTLKPISPDDVDGQRARRATANRILTVLKAALNLAYADGKVTSDNAWRSVKPFGNVEQARLRYLSDAEAVRLINASAPDFRDMVRAALVTACRYGELAAARVQDLNLQAGVLRIPKPKSVKTKPRAVILTDEAKELFKRLATGKTAGDLLLTRKDGSAWGKSYQQRPLTEACKNGTISPTITFYGLRHTHASRLAMAGTPMSVIAAQLGNSEAICAKHYAHLSPSYVSDTIRANFKRLEPEDRREAARVVEIGHG